MAEVVALFMINSFCSETHMNFDFAGSSKPGKTRTFLAWLLLQADILNVGSNGDASSRCDDSPRSRGSNE